MTIRKSSVLKAITFITFSLAFFAFSIGIFSPTVSAQAIVADIPINDSLIDESLQAVVNPTTNRAYVVRMIANGGPKQLLVIDIATSALIAVIDTGQLAKVVVNPATNRIYAIQGGTYAESYRVMVIDTNQILHVFSVPEHTRDLAVNPVTNRIYGVQGFTAADNHQQLRAFVIDGSTDRVL